MPSGTVIVADRLTVELNPDACITDVFGFETALRDAAKGKSDTQSSESLARATDQYSGILLPGYYKEWIVPEQVRISERFQEARTTVDPAIGRSRRDISCSKGNPATASNYKL